MNFILRKIVMTAKDGDSALVVASVLSTVKLPTDYSTQVGWTA